MNIETLREYCLSKKGTTEGFPFGEDTLVFKVMGKMYALTNLQGQLTVNLKCDPEYAIRLREEYHFVLPGYHMNKKHWNTIEITEFVPDKLLIQWIDHSYDLVVESLTNKMKKELKEFDDGTN